MSTFLLVGATFHSLREYLSNHGHDYIKLKDAAKYKGASKRFKRAVFCDFSSQKSIELAVHEVKDRFKVDGVLATYEDYVLPAAFAAQILKLPGLPRESAEVCTDKFLMRQRFAGVPKPISPDFSVVNSEQELLDFANAHSYPLILKPANLAKSLLVTKNHDKKELLANYHKTIENIAKVYARYSPNRPPKLLIEEFLDGSVHSVDAFVDKNGQPHILEQVVDYQTGYDIGYDDNFHYSRLLPSKLPKETIKQIRETAELGCQALGMKSSPAHIEIILTKKGPKIVEIGARSGGYRERMHEGANGIDIIGNAVRLALGQAPNITATRSEPFAVLELFPKKPGFFKELAGLKELEKLPSLVYLSVKAKPGDWIGKSSDGYKMSAIIMLHSKSEEQFNKDLGFVNNFVKVETTS